MSATQDRRSRIAAFRQESDITWLCDEVERLLAVVERLASSEGFCGAGILDRSFSGMECRARMQFATEALQ